MWNKGKPSKAVIIDGMHPRGISALSRTLNLVGRGMSEVLVSGNNLGNERGHWELQRINERPFPGLRDSRTGPRHVD